LQRENGNLQLQNNAPEQSRSKPGQDDKWMAWHYPLKTSENPGVENSAIWLETWQMFQTVQKVKHFVRKRSEYKILLRIKHLNSPYH
jgi:hypothetical protein